MPPHFLVESQGTDGAAPLLLFPQVKELGPATEGLLHLGAGAPLEVFLKVRIIGVGLATDLDMPLDWHAAGRAKLGPFCLPFTIGDFSIEGPRCIRSWAEVLLVYPGGALVAVPSSCPSPQRVVDGGVYFAECLGATLMSVISRPSFDLRVESSDEDACRAAAVSLDLPADLAQERLDVLGRWCGQVLSLVLSYPVTQKVEARSDGSDHGLVRRQFKTSVGQKSLHHWSDFLFQNLFTGAGDEKIVSVADEVDLIRRRCHVMDGRLQAI